MSTCYELPWGRRAGLIRIKLYRRESEKPKKDVGTLVRQRRKARRLLVLQREPHIHLLRVPRRDVHTDAGALANEHRARQELEDNTWWTWDVVNIPLDRHAYVLLLEWSGTSPAHLPSITSVDLIMTVT